MNINFGPTPYNNSPFLKTLSNVVGILLSFHIFWENHFINAFSVVLNTFKLANNPPFCLAPDFIIIRLLVPARGATKLQVKRLPPEGDKYELLYITFRIRSWVLLHSYGKTCTAMPYKKNFSRSLLKKYLTG